MKCLKCKQQFVVAAEEEEEGVSEAADEEAAEEETPKPRKPAKPADDDEVDADEEETPVPKKSAKKDEEAEAEKGTGNTGVVFELVGKEKDKAVVGQPFSVRHDSSGFQPSFFNNSVRLASAIAAAKKN